MKWLDILINKYRVVRIGTLTTAISMTWAVSAWAMRFAAETKLTGLDAAAVIAAVQAPVTLFAGSVFRAYIESRKEP